MSPTVEQQLLSMMSDTRDDVAEIKGKVIALDAKIEKREALCILTHAAVDKAQSLFDRRLDSIEDTSENTVQTQLRRAQDSLTHWHRYVTGALITAGLGGIGYLIVYALTHR